MDLAKVLHQLHEELANLNAAISSLERLEETNKHRSREPGWPATVLPPTRPVRKRKTRKAGVEGSQAAEFGAGEPGPG